MRSLSILIGLALIATAIFFKPPEPVLACSATVCGYLKGKHMFWIENGKHKRLNLITSQVSEVKIQKVRR